MWLNSGESQKTWFLAGFNDAMKFAGPSTRLTFACGAATVSETLKGIDRFFEEPANAQIPIWQGMVVFCMKVRGSTAAEIESKTVFLRKNSQAAK